MNYEEWTVDGGTFKSDEDKAPKTMTEFFARERQLIEVRPGNLRKWREAWTAEEFFNQLLVKAIEGVITQGITDPTVAIEWALEELSE